MRLQTSLVVPSVVARRDVLIVAGRPPCPLRQKPRTALRKRTLPPVRIGAPFAALPLLCDAIPPRPAAVFCALLLQLPAVASGHIARLREPLRGQACCTPEKTSCHRSQERSAPPRPH